jgi:hypothetical protein
MGPGRPHGVFRSSIRVQARGIAAAPGPWVGTVVWLVVCSGCEGAEREGLQVAMVVPVWVERAARSDRAVVPCAADAAPGWVPG